MLLSARPLLPPAVSPRRIRTIAPRGAPINAIGSFRSETRNANSVNLSSPEEYSCLVLHRMQSHASAPQQQLGFRRGPELGLVSLLFVISMIGGSFITLAAISFPVFSVRESFAVRRSKISMDKLSDVVSEEVPGTLSSLKLSGLEINDLTCQLKYLRQRISGNQYGKKARTNKARPRGGKK
ncbi:Uncharacterized protein M6B38_243240 [Iris pallida]|uniref:Uncharacterized protein n=1 Tax=Iris pallida TaxID=29817 RepID=A0AAX6DIN9_IRIPA|nr:Uncharacterized protein M6B38_243240 [Iris pallida]